MHMVLYPGLDGHKAVRCEQSAIAADTRAGGSSRMERSPRVYVCITLIILKRRLAEAGTRPVSGRYQQDALLQPVPVYIWMWIVLHVVWLSCRQAMITYVALEHRGSYWKPVLARVPSAQGLQSPAVQAFRGRPGVAASPFCAFSHCVSLAGCSHGLLSASHWPLSPESPLAALTIRSAVRSGPKQ